MDIECGRGNHSRTKEAMTKWDGGSANPISSGGVRFLEDASQWQDVTRGMLGIDFASYFLRGVLRASSSNSHAHGHH